MINSHQPLLDRLGRWVRLWRVELALAAAAVTAKTILARVAGPGTAALAVLAAAVIIIRVPEVNRQLSRILGRAARRRRWDLILSAIWPPPSTPIVTAVTSAPFGQTAQVRVAPGGTVSDIEARAEALAAAFAVHHVRVTRHPGNAAYATVRAVRNDPLDGHAPPWPWTHHPRTDLWMPVPVGVDEDGNHVAVELFEHNLLVDGEPGAGKSVAVAQLVAAAALDPTATLWLLDGKLVELAAWADTAAGTAGLSIGDAIGVLRHVQGVMDDRYAALLESRQRKLSRGSGLHVVVVDELAHYLTWPERKARDAFTDLLRDLVSRGRAAGVIVIGATQKPASDVIPTSLRDLFGYRWALRCTTAAASDTILGSGWATNGTSAASISPAARGVGYLLHESGLPIRLRAHHLDDPTVAHLAARAAHLRHQQDTP